MRSLNNEICHLPSDQLTWLLTIRKIFKPNIQYGNMDVQELIEAFKCKASEKDYSDIVKLLEKYDFEEYFKN